MGNGPQARLPGRLCSFSDMGRMPHSERAPPSSGTAALRFFPSPASKNPCGKRAKPAKPQPGGQSASQPPSHREGTTLERRGGPHAPFSSRPENPCGKRAKPAKPQPGGQQPGRHSRSREATAPATPPPQSVPSYPEPSEPARQSFHPDSSHASGSRSDSAWSQDASPRK